MMKITMRAGLLTVLTSLIASCGILAPMDKPADQKREPEDCSRGTFSFDFETSKTVQPLGSSKLLFQEMTKANKNRETVPLLDITHAAGWSDGWDILVEVGERTEPADLNTRAQTPGYCWRNLPASSAMSDRPSDKFYLFTKDNRPVQFIQFHPYEQPIQFEKGAVATKETVLVSNGTYLMPE
ncbi:hypothetical protein ACFV4K_27055 [Nocardia sp. NPDC059764]|uniref:hypothetical protein n=1 Tax=Nocardia sp. NPDC059764 TaxID=3346939 RepID=UPI0036665214